MIQPRLPCLILALLVLQSAFHVISIADPQSSLRMELDNSDGPDFIAFSARSSSMWTGNVSISQNQLVIVNSSDELRISPSANVTMGINSRIEISGRLVAEGTVADPIFFSTDGNGFGDGILLRPDARGKGSILRNVTISEQEYAVTLFGADILLDNVTILDGDRVGVDIYDGGHATIRNLDVRRIGIMHTKVSTSDWYYGIGITAGNGSSVLIEGANIENASLRGLNFWGGMGGVIRDLNVRNITGHDSVAVAGVWIEGGTPFFERFRIDRSERGFYIFDQDEAMAIVAKDGIISNSTFQGILADREDPLNTTIVTRGYFTNLTVQDTGTSTSIEPGLGRAGIEINHTGASLSDVRILDSAAAGLVLVGNDIGTQISDLLVERAGRASPQIHNSVGVYAHSTSDAVLSHITVRASYGSGIYFQLANPILTHAVVEANGLHGLHADDTQSSITNLSAISNAGAGMLIRSASLTTFSDITTNGNGWNATNAQNGAGIVFERSMVVSTNRGNVHCVNCHSTNDAWGGIIASRSTGLVLEGAEVRNPENDSSGIIIDQSAIIGSGRVDILDTLIEMNSTTAPAVDLVNARAWIERLKIRGNHSGMNWSGGNGASITGSSTLVDAELSGGCLNIDGHDSLTATDVRVSECTSPSNFSDAIVQLTDWEDPKGVHSLNLSGSSIISLHRSIGILASNAIITDSSRLDVEWDLEVRVRNQHDRRVPNAQLTLPSNSLNAARNGQTNSIGSFTFLNLVGERWTVSGSSGPISFQSDCTYDGTTNSTSVISLTQSEIAHCTLILGEQPPFLEWASPITSSIHGSGAEILFEANGSWDLDGDELTFQWISDIDGDLTASNPVPQTQYAWSRFIVNDVNGPPLSDGIHQITLRISDGIHFVEETRTIELRNLAPIVTLDTNPSVRPDGWIHLNRTNDLNLTFNLSDAENDPLTLVMRDGDGLELYREESILSTINYSIHLSLREYSGDIVALSIVVSDSVNPSLEITRAIRLFNEWPNGILSLTPSGPLSEDAVIFEIIDLQDPEGDVLQLCWSTVVDGQTRVLKQGGAEVVNWTGYLPSGVNTVSVRLLDEGHGLLPVDGPCSAASGLGNTLMFELERINTPAKSVIHSPMDGHATDSATEIMFSAQGSGDWDAPCSSLPDGAICSPSLVASGDLVTVRWESDLDGLLSTEWEVSKRLSAGQHTITLSIDEPGRTLSSSIQVMVSPSAPILIIDSPTSKNTYLSVNSVIVDIRQSFDPDDDVFLFDLYSDHSSNPLLVSADPSISHEVWLSSGEHQLTFVLKDSTGRNRSTVFDLFVEGSPPIARISSSNDVICSATDIEGTCLRMTVEAGEPINLTAIASSDADGNIVTYSWELMQEGDVERVGDVLSLNIQLGPGTHQFILRVVDEDGHSDEAHANITIRHAPPIVDLISTSPERLLRGVEGNMTIVAKVIDADNTTDTVIVKIEACSMEPLQTEMRDDGKTPDDVKNDGNWTAVILLYPPIDCDASIVTVQAIDPLGTTSGAQFDARDLIVPIRGVSSASQGWSSVLSNSIASPAIAIVIAIMAVIGALGLLGARLQKKRRLDGLLSAEMTGWALEIQEQANTSDDVIRSVIDLD